MDDLIYPDGFGEINKRRSKRRSGRMLRYLAVFLAAVVLGSVVTGWTLYRKFDADLERLSGIISNADWSSASGGGTALSQDKDSGEKISVPLNNVAYSQGVSIPQVVKEVAPSIVGIRTTITSRRSGFFGENLVQRGPEGSGIIIGKEGHIMTNYHVVEYADPKKGLSQNVALEVFLPDERQAKGQFIGGDEKTDLAVIKIDLDNLPAARLGDSSKLEVGELAIAIGNPLGMEFAGSVTAGIISALNRKVEVDGKTLNLIQTDAAINPGNSGGALVNSKGEVIGINTVKISTSGVEGLGFAIPINDAKPIVNQLIMFGHVKGRPALGIEGMEVTRYISMVYDLPMGVYITRVIPGSGADNAGIRRGDVIVRLAGEEIATLNDLENVKSKYKAGDAVDVEIVRNGKKMTLKLVFSEET